LEDRHISGQTEKKQARINDEIDAKSIRLIDVEGEALGIVPMREAQQKAQDAGLDLVEIAPNAEPPVCRIMDYGKYLFEINKKQSHQKKKTKQQQLKEIKFRPATDIGDYNIKLRKIKDFLEDGCKVKITVRFKGREIMHHELGLDLLRRVEHDLMEFASIDSTPKSEGKQITMVVSPRRAP
jgi:translation initiation factor IF-3